MTTRTLILAVAAAAWASAAGQPGSAQEGDAAKLIGMWRLIAVTQDGKPDPNRGASPTGYIYYDPSGRMAVQIMPDRSLRRPYAGQQPTPEEAQTALRGYTAYFGRYKVDERARTVTHYREGNINPGVFDDLVRRYEFLAGDRVALMPVESKNRLVWERVK